MKTILIPTDFSSSANNALRVAALIARQAKAEIHLLHSVRTNIDWAHLPIEKRASYPETLANIEKAESQLEKESWKPLLKGLKIHTHLVTGNTYEQIVHFANKKVKADLVVMGSHGPDEPKELFIGSNAQKTMRMAQCPVLTVKKNFKGKTFKKILFASDFAENVNASFEKILDVAKAVKAKIEMVFINTPTDFKNDDNINQIMDRFIAKYPGVKFSKAVYNHQLPDRGILNYSLTSKPDMISLVTHGNRHIPHYLLGVTETLVYHSDFPVLSMNIK
ncbi:MULTISPECIES: universal stress protein [unclassified Imperialibacter]|uniref:universal stress protein n=1 Tax=unclassified Imperialibacter TaxID=2629706 RepID=UPI00125C5547|nr:MULTISPECIES: universal stress protein [unclassified Imperialibacter]CAD5252862.1 putative stress response protein [Imperialibacter sp. 75]CAD5281103.1 putative stress response protein [Imperialibacter sp. 89]VVT28931.1 putative stress response protein [Imperialibacter sp. EC-SDR9]